METTPIPAARPPGRVGHDTGTENAAAEFDDRESDIDRFRQRVNECTFKADVLERKVNEVVEYYANKKHPNNSERSSSGKEEKKVVGHSNKNKSNRRSEMGGKKPVDSSRKEMVCSKRMEGLFLKRKQRMEGLMRQFDTILKQIIAHRWSEPFMNPVDVKGLGLFDYHEVIKKPMDFTTVKNKMKAKDENGYKTVREVYADVRLIFTNAMTYNDERNDVHVMAKTLLDKFEEKWLKLLPKVVAEETRQKDEEALAVANVHAVQESTFAKMAKDVNHELDKLNLHLDELREAVIQKCGKMSTEDKRKLGVGLSTLSPEDLNKALGIIAKCNPCFEATGEVVELDMDAQSESTLWKLKLFVKEALKLQTNYSVVKVDDKSKRKKEISDAQARATKKRKIKISS